MNSWISTRKGSLWPRKCYLRFGLLPSTIKKPCYGNNIGKNRTKALPPMDRMHSSQKKQNLQILKLSNKYTSCILCECVKALCGRVGVTLAWIFRANFAWEDLQAFNLDDLYAQHTVDQQRGRRVIGMPRLSWIIRDRAGLPKTFITIWKRSRAVPARSHGD